MTEEQSTLLQNYRRASWLTAIFILAGSAMDLVAYPHYWADFLVLRVVASLVLGVLFFFFNWPPSQKYYHILAHIQAFVPVLIIEWMILVIGDRESPYYAGLSLVLVGSVLMHRWSTTDGFINAVFVIGSYLGIALAIPTPFDAMARNTFFLVITASISCIGLYYYRRLLFDDFCLRDELEEQRQQITASHSRLKDLDEAKTKFFANISHELRTPLTLILAPLEKLKELSSVKDNEQILQAVSSMEENGLRLLRLINDLLDLVQLDSGEMRQRPERFQPATMIDGLGRVLTPMADKKGVSLDWTVDEASRGNVYLDRDRLEKIVLNLSVNALKFTPPGGSVTLEASLAEEMLEIKVSDTGAGMTSEEASSAFERFWQADSSVQRKHQGVGIGLALVKGLTESLSGTVDFKSTPGQGTRFTVRIPVDPAPVQETAGDEGEDKALDPFEELNQRARKSVEVPMDAAPQNPALPSPQQVQSGDREWVLIAEDEAGLRQFLKGEIEGLGCKVLEARDGLEARDLATQYLPNLVVSDFMMPELDGISLTHQLRQNPVTSQIPIVLVTARADDSPRVDALKAGVTDFLTKPFTTAELRLRIRNLLNGQRYQHQINVKNQELAAALKELRENEARLLHAEKLSSLGRMSAGIVHEINNPLNYTKTALHALRMYQEDIPDNEREEFADTLGDAEEGVGRVIQIVSDLRSFTKGQGAAHSPVSVTNVIESARRLLSQELREIAFQVEVAEDLTIVGNENQLVQVFVNLLQNAAQAVRTAPGGEHKPTIRISGETLPDFDIVLRVWDNGCGIPAEDLENIFDPFFTKRDVGEGMGLGLSICHRIIESHQARTEVRSEVGEFTEFTIFFPRTDDSTPQTSHANPPESSALTESTTSTQ